jgi:hypothetical protein
MIETLVVRIFGVDVSDTEVCKTLPWKIVTIVSFLIPRSGSRMEGVEKNGSFSSYALLKAVRSN